METAELIAKAEKRIGGWEVEEIRYLFDAAKEVGAKPLEFVALWPFRMIRAAIEDDYPQMIEYFDDQIAHEDEQWEEAERQRIAKIRKMEVVV